MSECLPPGEKSVRDCKSKTQTELKVLPKTSLMANSYSEKTVEASSDESCSDSEVLSCDDENWVPQNTSKPRHGTSKETEIDFRGNDSILQDISEQIRTVWKQVGRYLLERECLLENIEEDHANNSEKEKAYQMLLTWKRMLGSEASVQKIKNALVRIGRKDLADAVSSAYMSPRTQSRDRQQHSSTSSERTKSEIESHIKLQKKAIRKLKQNVKSYRKEVKEIEELRGKTLEQKEAKQLQEKLQELDSLEIQSKLDSLHRQVQSMHEKSKEYSELDKQLRNVADQLFAVDKTFREFSDVVADLRVVSISQTCRFGGIWCHFTMKYPRGSTSEPSRKSAKTEEEQEENVFQDPSLEQRSLRGLPCSRFSAPTDRLSMPSEANVFHHSLPRSYYTSQGYKLGETHVQTNFQCHGLLNDSHRNAIEARRFSFNNSLINPQDPVSSDQTYFNSLPSPCFKSSQAIASLVTRSLGRYQMPSCKTNEYGHFSLQQGSFNMKSVFV